LVEPVTVAVNCAVPLTCTEAVDGETEIETGGGTVAMLTVAEADFVESACDVPVTTTDAGDGCAAGAVYRPVDVIVPQPDPMHPGPESVQVTAVLVVPDTLAVNCCVLLVVTVALAGLIETATGAGGACTVATALADFVVSA